MSVCVAWLWRYVCFELRVYFRILGYEDDADILLGFYACERMTRYGWVVVGVAIEKSWCFRSCHGCGLASSPGSAIRIDLILHRRYPSYIL